MTVSAPPSPPAAQPPAAQPPAAQPPARSLAVRRAWIVVGLVAALAAVGVWVPSFIVNEFDTSHATLTPTRQVITSPVSTLTVDVASGSVTVERGASSGAVVESSGSRSERVPTNEVRLTGHTLAISSSCGFGVFNDWCVRNYVLQVPPGASVTAQLGTGAIAVSGIDGALKLGSEDGSVTVTGGGSHSPVQAASGTGSVTVDNVHGPVDVTTQNGDVNLRDASGAVRATSSTGSVTATGLTGSSVVARTEDGTVAVTFGPDAGIPNLVTASSGTGSVTVGLPAGPSVGLHPTPQATYRVDDQSATGRVTTAVATDPTSPHVVRATSQNGDVTVRYAPG